MQEEIEQILKKYKVIATTSSCKLAEEISQIVEKYVQKDIESKLKELETLIS